MTEQLTLSLFFSQKKNLDKSDVWLSRVKMKKSLVFFGPQLPHLTSPHVSTLTTWPVPKFLVPSPFSCWDGTQPRTPSLVRFQVPTSSACQTSVILLLWLGLHMILQKHGAGGCSWGRPRGWGLCLHSTPAGKSSLPLPSVPSAIVPCEGIMRGGEQDLFVILGISRYILVFLKEHWIWNQKIFSESWFCHWLIIKTWASHLTSRETFPTIQWQQSFNMDTSTQWLETLAPSFIKTVLLVWGIFVMGFYSAGRDNVFIAVANYRIKGSMALELRTGTPVSVRLPGFTSFIYLSAVTLDKLTSLCASPFSHL